MELLQAKWDEGKFVCVGLDSDAGKLPIVHLGRIVTEAGFLGAQEVYRRLQAWKPGEELIELPDWQKAILAQAQLAFNERIIDATKDVACAYKPNSAFYEALGDHGIRTLNGTINYAHMRAPDVPVILDFKRGDIDNTNAGYIMAAAIADAVTVHPYLGFEAMKPFLDQKDKGVIVLVRTSNRGAGEFQDKEVVFDYYADSGEAQKAPLYQLVAAHVANPRLWNYNSNCCVVAGATYPEELMEIRRIVGHMPILIPGIGAQGGALEATVKAGANSRRQGMIINNSRGIIFASDGEDFDDVARTKTQEMHEAINTVLATV